MRQAMAKKGVEDSDSNGINPTTKEPHQFVAGDAGKAKKSMLWFERRLKESRQVGRYCPRIVPMLPALIKNFCCSLKTLNLLQWLTSYSSKLQLAPERRKCISPKFPHLTTHFTRVLCDLSPDLHDVRFVLEIQSLKAEKYITWSTVVKAWWKTEKENLHWVDTGISRVYLSRRDP